MAGMAEMAQMAAILKYKQQCQCNNNGNGTLMPMAGSCKAKDRRCIKLNKENYTKNLQGRWRDMKENFGCCNKTAKGLKKKLL